MDRAAQFAVVAAREALRPTAASTPAALDPHRIGVTVGSAVGCTMGLEQEYLVVSDGGATGWSTTTTRSRTCTTTSCPARSPAEVGLDGRRRGPGDGGLHRLHLRPGLRRARRRADPRGHAPTS